MKKQFFIIINVLLISFSAFTQSGNIDFNIRKSFGGNLSEFPMSVICDSSNLYVIVTSESNNIFNIDTLPNDSLNRIYLVKMDLNAEIIWVKQIENDQNYKVNDINMKNDKIYISFIYDDKITPVSAEIREYNTSGIIITNNQVLKMGTNQNYGSMIIEFDSDNNFIIYGSYGDTIIIGTDTIIMQAFGYPRNYYISKLDSNLDHTWFFNLGGNSATISGLALDNDNNIYFTGNYQYNHLIYDQFEINTTYNNQFNNFYIAKISNGGSLVWHNEIGQDLGSSSNANNRSTDICYIDSIGIIITGDIAGYLTFGDTIFNSFVNLNYLANYDTSGNFLKLRTFDSNSINMYIKRLTVDNANNIYMTGSYSTNIIGTQNFNIDGNNISTTFNGIDYGYQDLYIFKFNSNLQNARTITLNNDTSLKLFYCKTLMPNNNLILLGRFENTILFNDNYLMNNYGNVDCFVLSIKDSLENNIILHSSKDNKLSLYPNPTDGNIYLEIENIQDVEVINLQGRLIFKNKENEIDLSKEPKGIYIIRVTTDKGVAVEKVILQ